MAEKLRLQRVWALVNTAAGSVGPEALQGLAEIFATTQLEPQVTVSEPANLKRDLAEAVAAKPDLLVVLAGDGTARSAAALVGPHGPPLMTLPGGTLNILPRALYGERDWRAALTDTLAAPQLVDVGGGEVDGHAFFVAAVLGAPALWASAREAVREGHLLRAVERGRLAFKRAFSSRLRYSIEGGEEDKAEALAILCPLISKVLDNAEQVLEIAAMDPAGLGDAVRMGLLASVGRWRQDPSVHLAKARSVKLRAHRAIPCIIDGEPVSLGRTAQVRFTPRAFRALVPAS